MSSKNVNSREEPEDTPDSIQQALEKRQKEARSSRRTRIGIGGVVLLGSVVCVVFGVTDYLDQRSLAARHRTTSATIVESRLVETQGKGGKKTYRPRIVYTYSVGKASYRSETIDKEPPEPSEEQAGFSKLLNRYPKGKRVTAYYLVDKPGRARLTSPDPGLEIIIGLGVCALFASFGFLGVLSGARVRVPRALRVPPGQTLEEYLEAEKKRNQQRGIPGLLIGIGIYLFIPGVVGTVVSCQERNAIVSALQRYRPTQAKVVETSIRYECASDDSHDDWYVLAVLFEYEVGGTRYRSDRYSHLGDFTFDAKKDAQKIQAKLPAGTEITVYYDPDKPSDAVWENKASTLLLTVACVVMPLVALGSLALVVYGFVRRRRFRRQDELDARAQTSG